MKVYLLMHQVVYEAADVVGVFSSLDAATAAKSAVWSASRDWLHNGSIDVSKFEDLFIDEFSVDPEVLGIRGECQKQNAALGD